jgi:hypothetical protein
MYKKKEMMRNYILLLLRKKLSKLFHLVRETPKILKKNYAYSKGNRITSKEV